MVAEVAPSVPTSDLVARDGELARLDDALRRALEGSGRVLLIAGEAGQGKSKLMRTFAERATARRPDLLAATGVCNAFTGQGDPFLPFRQIAATLATGANTFLDRFASRRSAASRSAEAVPPLFDPLTRPVGVGQAALRVEVATALLEFANNRPLLLLVDDLQWADESSLELLLHLGRVVGLSPILVLAAFRPADVAPSPDGHRHPFERVLHELERQFGEEPIELDRADGRTFIDRWIDRVPNVLGPDFREALWHQTGGNPLFTLELLRAMLENGDLVQNASKRWTTRPDLCWTALPTRITGTLAERIGRLGNFDQDVLRVASVEGETFTSEVAARVLGTEPRDVARALEARLEHAHHLVQPVSVERSPAGGRLSRYRFHHNLVQRFVLDNIGDSERSYLHEAVADALLELASEKADPIALAYHFERAHAPERAAPFLRRAGDLAKAAFALKDAIAAYKAVLGNGSRLDPASRAEILLDLAECQGLQFDYGGVIAGATEARDLYLQLGDRRAAGATEVTLAAALSVSSMNPAEGLAVVRNAIDVLEEGGDSVELARAYGVRARAHLGLAEDDLAESWGRRALDLSERLNDPGTRAHALATVAVAMVRAGTERQAEAFAMLGDAHDLADAAGRYDEAAVAVGNVAGFQRATGAYDDALRSWNGLHDYTRRRGLAMWTRHARLESWRLAWRLGRWETCVPVIPEWRSEAAASPEVSLALAEALIDLGRPRDAHASVAPHWTAIPAGLAPSIRIHALGVLLRIAAALEETDTALATTDRILETVRELGVYPFRTVNAVLHATRWLAGHPVERAPALVSEALEVLNRTERQFHSSEVQAAVLEAHAAVAQLDGAPDRATTLLEQAAERWQATGFPLDEATARTAAAGVLHALGRHEDATRQSDRTATIVDALQSAIPSDAFRASFTERHGRPATLELETA